MAADENTTAGRIVLERHGPTATLRLDNERRRNALTLSMLRDLGDALDEVARDAAVRLVTLEGAGTRAFCSGADIGGFADAERARAEHRHYAGAERGVFDRLRALAKPTVAVVRGYCFGGGVLLASVCDLRFALPDAKLGLPAARLGIAYPRFGVDRLVELVGRSRARSLLYTAETVDAPRAEAIGLVDAVLDEPGLRERLAGIAVNAPLTLAAAKAAVAAYGAGDDSGTVAAAVAACWASADFVEGRTAFHERRTPNFTGS